jgi:hypothetical protein
VSRAIYFTERKRARQLIRVALLGSNPGSERPPDPDDNPSSREVEFLAGVKTSSLAEQGRPVSLVFMSRMVVSLAGAG